MLTYPRFAKACYAFFAVAVLAAILKVSISGAEPALLKMLPATPTASAVEPAPTPPQSPEDPRLGSFSDDGVKHPQAVFSRSASRERVPEGSDEGSYGPSRNAFVFRRPSLEQSSSSGPVCGDLGDVPRSSRVVFPLPEQYFNSYDDTWGAARPQGGHEGSDLMSPAGTPELAITDGRIVGVAGSNENGWNRLGGYTLMLQAANDVGPIKKGDLFYYAHMDRESALPLGTEVRAGQRIGTVGDTGEGPEVTRGKFPPHLHLGWYDANLSEARSQAESGAMNPYPLLLWFERNGGAVSGGTDTSYCQAPQSPSRTPSTGKPDWPTPSSPSQRPDLDTGSDENASPAMEDEPYRYHPESDGGKNRGNREDRSEDNEHKAKVKVASNDAEKPGKASRKAMELPPRKEIEDRTDAPHRDLPSLEVDQTTPRDRGEVKQDAEKKGDGRRDGEAEKERDEGRRKVERPAENRPEKDRPVPPKETLKPPVSTAPVPDRKLRPAPKETDEDNGVVEEPEIVASPKAEREDPSVETKPLPDTATSEPTVEDTTPKDAAVAARDEVPPAVREEAELATEPDRGQQREGLGEMTPAPVSAPPVDGARGGSS